MSAVNNKLARRLGAAVAVTVLALTAGCGVDPVTVSDQAVKATSTAFRSTDHLRRAAVRLPFPRRLTLPPADLARLSRGTGLGQDVLATVAPELHQQPAWRLAFERSQRAYQVTPDDVRDSLVSLGCQAVTGQIRTEKQLRDAVDSQAVALALSPSETLSFYYGALQLSKELAQAAGNADRDKASVVLFCYVVDQVTV
jgi:hypothetical protein